MSWKKVEEASIILNIPTSSSIQEIKKAYKKKALQNHPDKGGDGETFAKLTNAYETMLHKDEYKEIPILSQSFFFTSTENDLQTEASELFDILENLSIFSNISNSANIPKSPNIQERYEKKEKENKKKSSYTIRVSIQDIWKYYEKRCTIGTYNIRLPLYYSHIHFTTYTNQCIYVEIEEKNTEYYTRKNKWDMHIHYPIDVEKLYTTHIMEIVLPDTSKEHILWKKDFVQNIQDTKYKGFIIQNKGFYIPNTENNGLLKRGLLFVEFVIQLPSTLHKVHNDDTIVSQREYINPVFVEDIDWKYSKSKRKKLVKIEKYI